MKKGVGDDPFADDKPGESAEETTETDPDMSQSAAPEPEPAVSFVEQIVATFEQIERGEKGKTVSFRDTSIKALLLALEENDQARQQLAEDLGLDEDDGRSDAVRALLRAGLRAESPENFEALAEARAEHARDRL